MRKTIEVKKLIEELDYLIFTIETTQKVSIIDRNVIKAFYLLRLLGMLDVVDQTYYQGMRNTIRNKSIQAIEKLEN